MSAVPRNTVLNPFVDELYLTVIPARNPKTDAHQKLRKAQDLVTKAVMARYRDGDSGFQSGAAIYGWDNARGRWNVLTEVDPGRRVPYRQMPWHPRGLA